MNKEQLPRFPTEQHKLILSRQKLRLFPDACSQFMLREHLLHSLTSCECGLDIWSVCSASSRISFSVKSMWSWLAVITGPEEPWHIGLVRRKRKRGEREASLVHYPFFYALIFIVIFIFHRRSPTPLSGFCPLSSSLRAYVNENRGLYEPTKDETRALFLFMFTFLLRYTVCVHV